MSGRNDQYTHAGASEPPSSRPIPGIVRRISRPFGLRHAKGVAAVRYAVAGWLVVLGCIMCAVGGWWGCGALMFPAAAGVGALAYLMPRWQPALEAEGRTAIVGEGVH